MRKIILLFILGCLNLPKTYSKNFITISPGDCPNCMSAITLIGKNNNVYVFKEAYKIDSSSLRHKYRFLNDAPMIFSDSLFNLYSINGFMTISNSTGSIKCPLAKYTRKVHGYYTLFTDTNKIDTIVYSSYPIAKASIQKRVFTHEGKVYLLNGADNNVILFDLFNDEVVDTFTIPEIAKVDAYYQFGLKKSKNDYNYYYDLIKSHIQDNFCTIKNIAVNRDTVHLYISNYYCFFKGKDNVDTFLSHFQSIATFVNGTYLDTKVPSNIQEKLIDTVNGFYAEEGGFYVHNGIYYCSLFNSFFHSGKDKYSVGGFNSQSHTLHWVIKLEGVENSSYNFSNPLFYDNYCLIAKSCKLYNLEGQNSFMDLNYFKQNYDGSKLYLPDFVNFDFQVKGKICTVLYNDRKRNMPYYSKIDIEDKKIIINRELPQIDNNLARILSPFNNNDVLEFADNFKIIKYNVAPYGQNL